MSKYATTALLFAAMLCLGASNAHAQLGLDRLLPPDMKGKKHDKDEHSRLDLGHPAPDLIGQQYTGTPVALTDYRGRWVFIDFWASWCNPCMKELPNVVKASKALVDRGDISFIGVSLDSDQTFDQFKKVVADGRVPFPVVYDSDGNNYISDSWGVQLIPTTFLIDPQGNIAARDIGASEVKRYLDSHSKPAAKPVAIRSNENLLPDSPSTGRNDMRDLVIGISMPDGSQPLNRYQLYVSAASFERGGEEKHVNWVYEVSVAKGADGNTKKVEIEESSGRSYTDAVRLNSAPAITKAGANSRDAVSKVLDRGSRNPSALLVALDDVRHEYQLILPVPSGAHDLSYALAFFDDQMQDYVRNGLVSIDTN